MSTETLSLDCILGDDDNLFGLLEKASEWVVLNLFDKAVENPTLWENGWLDDDGEGFIREAIQFVMGDSLLGVGLPRTEWVQGRYREASESTQETMIAIVRRCSQSIVAEFRQDFRGEKLIDQLKKRLNRPSVTATMRAEGRRVIAKLRADLK